MRSRDVPLGAITLLYAVAYLPYVVLTRRLATVADPVLGRPLTGLEILPALQILSAVLTFVSMAAMGWMRSVHRVRIGGLRIPGATRWTATSGVCTALVLITVPFSYTLANVSVPLMQLLMRGDLLIVAPLVDLLSRRRVRWWSWGALALVAMGIVLGFHGRGEKPFPPAAIVTVLLYTLGYFGRLFIMSKVAKSGNQDQLRRFFAEEKIVAFPIVIVALAAAALLAGGHRGDELHRGFVSIWTTPQVLPIAICALMICLTGFLAAYILLDPRENSFCVPLERSASILAGVIGSLILARLYGVPAPSPGEFAGAGTLVLALCLLSIAPRHAARRAQAIGTTVTAEVAQN